MKSPKTNTLADGLIKTTSSILDGMTLKTVYLKMKKEIKTEKRGKTLNEVKPVKNISRNLKSFLEISIIQKEVLLSHKLQDHAYE